MDDALALHTILIVILLVMTGWQQWRIEKHQKALEWFMKHVHIDPKSKDADPPKEVRDTLK